MFFILAGWLLSSLPADRARASFLSSPTGRRPAGSDHPLVCHHLLPASARGLPRARPDPGRARPLPADDPPRGAAHDARLRGRRGLPRPAAGRRVRPPHGRVLVGLGAGQRAAVVHRRPRLPHHQQLGGQLDAADRRQRKGARARFARATAEPLNQQLPPFMPAASYATYSRSRSIAVHPFAEHAPRRRVRRCSMWGKGTTTTPRTTLTGTRSLQSWERATRSTSRCVRSSGISPQGGEGAVCRRRVAISCRPAAFAAVYAQIAIGALGATSRATPRLLSAASCSLA